MNFGDIAGLSEYWIEFPECFYSPLENKGPKIHQGFYRRRKNMIKLERAVWMYNTDFVFHTLLLCTKACNSREFFLEKSWLLCSFGKKRPSHLRMFSFGRTLWYLCSGERPCTHTDLCHAQVLPPPPSLIRGMTLSQGSPTWCPRSTKLSRK